MAVKFLELDKEFKERMCTIPQAVFSTQNPDDETQEQVIDRQNKFIELPEAIKDKLVSHETADKIKAIGAHYNLELLQMAPIARVIRNYYFGKVKIEEFAGVIEKESKISRADAENVARYLVDRIIGKNVSSTKPVVKTEKMPLIKAMEIYPSIKNQKITSYSIDVEGTAVAPTVDNWIKDYYYVVGAGNRDIVKRSSYLYHSKNVKNITATDRQMLSTVLKSLDEGILIDILPERGQIYFDNSASNKATNNDIASPKKSPVEEDRNEYLKPEILEKGKEPEKGVGSDEGENFLLGKDKASELEINHVHGNNLDLGSSHFKESNKKSIFSFFGKNKKSEEGDVSFSFPQQLPVEKEKMKEIPRTANNTNTQNTRSDFFGKIKPLDQ